MRPEVAAVDTDQRSEVNTLSGFSADSRETGTVGRAVKGVYTC